jgi:hypothetical protein
MVCTDPWRNSPEFRQEVLAKCIDSCKLGPPSSLLGNGGLLPTANSDHQAFAILKPHTNKQESPSFAFVTFFRFQLNEHDTIIFVENERQRIAPSENLLDVPEFFFFGELRQSANFANVSFGLDLSDLLRVLFAEVGNLLFEFVPFFQYFFAPNAIGDIGQLKRCVNISLPNGPEKVLSNRARDFIFLWGSSFAWRREKRHE